MTTVHLGQHGDVLDDLDLARRLNAQLQAGQVRLDFAGVHAVSRPFAAALLDGLDLGRVGDDLGAETMTPAVADVFAGGPGEPGAGGAESEEAVATPLPIDAPDDAPRSSTRSPSGATPSPAIGII